MAVAALFGLVACGVVLAFTLSLGGVLAAMLGGAGAGFALVSALTVLASSNYVNAGYLNVTYARQARRVLVFIVIVTIVNAGVSSLALAASASQDGLFPVAARVCLALLWLPSVVSLVGMSTVRKLLNWAGRVR